MDGGQAQVRDNRHSRHRTDLMRQWGPDLTPPSPYAQTVRAFPKLDSAPESWIWLASRGLSLACSIPNSWILLALGYRWPKDDLPGCGVGESKTVALPPCPGNGRVDSLTRVNDYAALFSGAGAGAGGGVAASVVATAE
jgi:hypothetical protein